MNNNKQMCVPSPDLCLPRPWVARKRLPSPSPPWWQRTHGVCLAVLDQPATTLKRQNTCSQLPTHSGRRGKTCCLHSRMLSRQGRVKGRLPAATQTGKKEKASDIPPPFPLFNIMPYFTPPHSPCCQTEKAKTSAMWMGGTMYACVFPNYCVFSGWKTWQTAWWCYRTCQSWA